MFTLIQQTQKLSIPSSVKKNNDFHILMSPFCKPVFKGKSNVSSK